MSQICVETVTCPRCGTEQEMTLFRSLNGERVPAQVACLLDGTFELRTCEPCGHAFRPEHRMLYAHVSAGTWVVMYPHAERARFATLEHGIAASFARQIAGAPDLVSPLLQGVRPRLVFGHHMLSESVRVTEAGIEPAVLECAKLLAYRRHMERLMPHGPVELCYEAAPTGEDIQLGVHALATGQRVDELLVSVALLDEAAASRERFERQYPDLFGRPYISATRYLYGALA